MSIIAINSQDEFVKLIEENKNCIIDFYAEWCNPCKKVSTELNKIIENYPDIKILKVNMCFILKKTPSLLRLNINHNICRTPAIEIEAAT